MTALMIGIQGKTLSSQDISNIKHPCVCGVILFSRNYESHAQLKGLISHIKSVCGTDFLIAVDQEGGRVIRFKHPFTQLPSLGSILHSSDGDLEKAQALAHLHAWIMASELLSVGVDLSFTPVLDIDNGSEVIGDRAFSNDPKVVLLLARAYCGAMHHAGMKTTGKHFPGHGTVSADSHFKPAVDTREHKQIESLDMYPFSQMVRENRLDAMMLSHVIYPKICEQAAGYSQLWCEDILRKQLGFKGVSISDDLDMQAATYIGSLSDRYQACCDAKIDLTLVCSAESSTALLEKLTTHERKRLPQLVGHGTLRTDIPFWEQQQWQNARMNIEHFKVDL